MDDKIQKLDDGSVRSLTRPHAQQSSYDQDGFARVGDTLTFMTSLTVENNGFFVTKTYYHEISIKQVIDGNNCDVPGAGIYMRLISQGVKR